MAYRFPPPPTNTYPQGVFFNEPRTPRQLREKDFGNAICALYAGRDFREVSDVIDTFYIDDNGFFNAVIPQSMVAFASLHTDFNPASKTYMHLMLEIQKGW